MKPLAAPRIAVIIVFLLFVTFTCWQAVKYRPFIIDDAYITFRYAQNLSNGAGLAFNGNEQVEGYSNFLLVLLLALGLKVGIKAPLLAQVIGMASLLGLLALLFAETERQTGVGWGVLIAPFLLASSVAISYWAVAGLETLLYTFLLTAAVIVASRCLDFVCSPWLLWLILAFLVLCRTEGAAPAGLIGAYYTFKMLPEEKRGTNGLFDWFKALLPIIIVIALYHGFRVAWFGSFQSAPAAAKFRGSIFPLTEGLRYLTTFFVEYVPSLLVLFVGYSLLQSTSLTFPLLIVLCFQLLIVLYLGGDWMPMYRMFVPLLPLLFLEAGRGMRLLCRKVELLRPIVFLALLVAATRLAFFPVAQYVNITQCKMLDGLFVEVSKHLKKNYPQGTRIVLGDIGRIGYETGFEIYDMKGLVSPWISKTYKRVKEANHYRVSIDSETILQRRPELVLVAVNRRSRDGMVDDGVHRGFWSCDTDMLKSSTLHRGWKVVARMGDGNTIGCTYLLFERKDLWSKKP